MWLSNKGTRKPQQRHPRLPSFWQAGHAPPPTSRESFVLPPFVTIPWMSNVNYFIAEPWQWNSIGGEPNSAAYSWAGGCEKATPRNQAALASVDVSCTTEAHTREADEAKDKQNILHHTHICSIHCSVCLRNKLSLNLCTENTHHLISDEDARILFTTVSLFFKFSQMSYINVIKY